MEGSKVKVKVYWRRPLVFLLVIGVYFLGASQGRRQESELIDRAFTNRDNGRPEGVDFSLFWTVWRRVNEEFFGEVISRDALYGAISGMVRGLNDPYSDFLNPEMAKDFDESIDGEFAGIGIEIGEKKGLLVVIAPLEGTPAEKAGLKPEDAILEIDGKETSQMSLSEAVRLMRGQEGTKVVLLVFRQAMGKTERFEITRAKIEVPSVSLKFQEQGGKTFGLLKIGQFGSDTVSRMRGAADLILKRSVDGLILDLRNNPGGFLDVSIDVASFFIDQGPIARQIGRAGREEKFQPTEQPRLKDIPLVVLIDKGTASAAEIVAGAIGDHRAGLILGENSFGKGTVQNYETLFDGSALKITVGRWLTADGREIHEVGIVPDRQAPDDPATKADESLEEAFKVMLTE